MTTISTKLISKLGNALQSATEQRDLFLTIPELAEWVEQFNLTMIGRGQTDNIISLFTASGELDPDSLKYAFSTYNAMYLYNRERAAVYRDKNTGISLVNPVDYSIRIPTKVRKRDRTAIIGRGADDIDTTEGKAAESIMAVVEKKKIAGVTKVKED